MSTAPVFPLIALTQSYDWGKLGSESKAAQYALTASPGFAIDETKPYAELWMGTHVTLPSTLVSGTRLSDHLAANPELLGSKVAAHFSSSSDLPFLFKVLAIRKALSIQAHPDKKLAERLHAERPNTYKDPNHKPEMAIALTSFRALCGFLPLPQISLYLSHVPELAALIPPDVVSSFRSDPNSETLKAVFSAVMNAEPSLVQEQLSKLIHRYTAGDFAEAERPVVYLAIELDSQFPGDIGVFCIYLLNVIDLEPGQAIFLGAGEPHAYVSGDIVECMATSDNVLRAGLTPKERDVPNLVGSLTYIAAPGSKHLVAPSSFSTYTTLYDPPVPEFSVLRVAVPSGEAESHRAINGPSVLIVTGGEGRAEWEGRELDIKEGSVVFLGASTPVKFVATAGELVGYRAFVEAP